MLATRKSWIWRLTFATLIAAGLGALLPDSADAQIFGGRIRNWLRGNRVERIPPDEAVIIERRYAEPRIVMPGEPEPAYEAPRSRAGNDYGPGVSQRLRRERGFSVRRRPSRTYDDDMIPEGRTVRSLEERRSAQRAPVDRWERDRLAEERRFDDADLADAPPEEFEPGDEADRDLSRRDRERTVRVDEYERRSSVSPAEDPYEPDDRRDSHALSSRETVERDLELGDARGRRDEADLLEPPPAGDPGGLRTDERVRPVAAEEAATDNALSPRRSVKAGEEEIVDEFDTPRSLRERQPAETAPARDQGVDEEEAELLPPPPEEE